MPKRRSVHGLPIVVPGLLRRSPAVDRSASLASTRDLATPTGASFVPSLSHGRAVGTIAQSERSRIPRHVVQNGNLINNKIHRSVEEQRRRRRSKDEIPSSPPSDYTDMSRFFVFYVGVKVIVLPGHWPSLSLSLLSAKWIFRNVICCAARSETFLR